MPLILVLKVIRKAAVDFGNRIRSLQLPVQLRMVIRKTLNVSTSIRVITMIQVNARSRRK